MNKQPLYRIILDTLILLAILQGWWFVVLLLAIVGAWKYSSFAEIIIAGMMYDSLYGFVQSFGVRGYMGTIISVLFFVPIVVLKRVMRK